MASFETRGLKVRKWIPPSPCHGANRPPDPPARGRALLTAEEIAAICTSTGYLFDPELRTRTAKVGACFLLALETGMRSGEILRLRPADYRKAQRHCPYRRNRTGWPEGRS